jgi:hypothetical protein
MEAVTPVAVKVADALIELLSMAATLLAPAAVVGTVKATLIVPAPVDVVVVTVPAP